MRTRTTTAIIAGVGALAAGAAVTVPAIAGAAMPAVVDTIPDETTAPDDPTGTDEAADDGSADSAGSARGDRVAAILESLVTDGTLTEEQLDAVVAELLEAIPVPARGDDGDLRRGDRPGHLGRGGGVAVSLDTLTDTLGVTADELRDAFGDEQSIADVAAAQGVDVQEVIDALAAADIERIDAAVAAGRLTTERGEEAKAALVEHLTELVEQPGGPAGPFGGGWPDVSVWQSSPAVPGFPPFPGAWSCSWEHEGEPPADTASSSESTETTASTEPTA